MHHVLAVKGPETGGNLIVDQANFAELRPRVFLHPYRATIFPASSPTVTWTMSAPCWSRRNRAARPSSSAAAGLSERGMDVTVVHLMPALMERQLDPTAGHLLKRQLEARGIKILTQANTKEIIGTDNVSGVRLEDGTEIAAKLVIMAVGIQPRAALAGDAGLEVNRGILVDARMRTSDPDIFFVGECVKFRGNVYGLVAPLYEMANVVATELAGEESDSFIDSAIATRLKLTGVNLFSAGDFAEREGRDEIVLRDAEGGVYKRLVLQDNRIIGAVLYGDTADGAWFFQLIRDGTDISEMRDTLIFGPAYAGGAQPDPTAAVAVLPDEAEICGCNGICKGMIVETIEKEQFTSLHEVRARTKASASCGTCTGLVEQLLTLTLGDAYNPAAVPPMCGG
jgi:nitrite reductase (NADH) large subunit